MRLGNVVLLRVVAVLSQKIISKNIASLISRFDRNLQVYGQH